MLQPVSGIKEVTSLLFDRGRILEPSVRVIESVRMLVSIKTTSMEDRSIGEVGVDLKDGSTSSSN